MWPWIGPAARVGLLACALGLGLGAGVPAAGAAGSTGEVRPVDVLSYAASGSERTAPCTLDRAQAWIDAVAERPRDRAIFGAAFLGALYGVPDGAPFPVAELCDGDRFARGAVGGAITGSLADARPLRDVIARGYRALEAPAWQVADGEAGSTPRLVRGRAAGLIPGDRLRLPATSGPNAGAVVWVQAGAGAQRVAFAPGDAIEVQARRTATGAVELSSVRAGVETITPITALPAVRVASQGRLRRGTLRVQLSGLPAGAEIVVTAGKRSAVARADSGGSARLVLPARRARATVIWSDLETRRAGATRCVIGARPRACVRDATAATARALPAGEPPSAGDGGPMPQPATPLARSARATVTAPQRFPMRVVPLDVPTASVAQGDVDGDDHADILGVRDDEQALARLFISGPDGGVRTSIPLEAGYARDVGDVDGDGLRDTLLQGGDIAFGTGELSALSAVAAAEDPAQRVLRLAVPDDDSLPGGPDDARPVPDATGDGKPELAVRVDDVAMVLASEHLARGATVILPRFAVAPQDLAREDDDAAPSPLLTPTGLVTVAVERPSTRRRPIGTIAIVRTDPAGRVQRSAALELRGVPAELERDEVTGDLLVSAVHARGRGIPVTSVRHLDPTGAPLSSTSLRGAGAIRFGPDGADADQFPELFAQDRAGIRVLGSEIRGAVAGASLQAVTDARGRLLPASIPSRDSGDGEGATARSLTVRGLGPWRFPQDHWSRLLPIG